MQEGSIPKNYFENNEQNYWSDQQIFDNIVFLKCNLGLFKSSWKNNLLNYVLIIITPLKPNYKFTSGTRDNPIANLILENSHFDVSVLKVNKYFQVSHKNFDHIDQNRMLFTFLY